MTTFGPPSAPAAAGGHTPPTGGPQGWRRYADPAAARAAVGRLASRRRRAPRTDEPPLIKGAIVEAVGALILGVGIYFATAGLTIFGIPGLLGVAIAHGVILAALILAFHETSGAHLSAAVSAGMMVVGECGVVRMLIYTAARIFGFTMASLIVSTVYERVHNDAPGYAPFYGIAKPADPGMSAWITFWMEAFGAFVVVLAIVAALKSDYGKGMVAAAGGAALTGAVLINGLITGAAINPERNFGPMLVAWWYDAGQFVGWFHFWGYMLGGVIGGVAAGGFYKALLARQIETTIR